MNTLHQIPVAAVASRHELTGSNNTYGAAWSSTGPHSWDYGAHGARPPLQPQQNMLLGLSAPGGTCPWLTALCIPRASCFPLQLLLRFRNLLQGPTWVTRMRSPRPQLHHIYKGPSAISGSCSQCLASLGGHHSACHTLPPSTGPTPHHITEPDTHGAGQGQVASPSQEGATPHGRSELSGRGRR